jgi:hypothetical protein
MLTIFIMLVFSLVIGLWHLCRSTSSTTSSNSTSEDAGEEAVTTADAEVQTSFSWYDLQALKDQYEQADLLLDHYKQEIEDFTAMVNHQNEVEKESFEMMDRMSIREFELRRLVEAPVFHTKHSKEYHRKRDYQSLTVK